MQSLASNAQAAAQAQAAAVAGLSGSQLGGPPPPRNSELTDCDCVWWISLRILTWSYCLSFSRYNSSSWNRCGRPASAVYFEVELREGLGSGLSAAVDQGHAVLGRGASTPCPAVAGRGAAQYADRWTAWSGVEMSWEFDNVTQLLMMMVWLRTVAFGGAPQMRTTN